MQNITGLDLVRALRARYVRVPDASAEDMGANPSLFDWQAMGRAVGHRFHTAPGAL